jgi:hypothetical protein
MQCWVKPPLFITSLARVDSSLKKFNRVDGKAPLSFETAMEIFREIEEYNDAYLYYLVAVYLPRALRRDPTFGLRARDLLWKIHERMEKVGNPATLKGCEKFLHIGKDCMRFQ